jgi:predicted anti-sigma-YlaC factor YlaD
MSHVDEGTLHALLDGELAPAEVVEVQTHFATCPACSARLDSARRLLAETERLVSALEPSRPLAERLGARAARPPVAPPPPAPPPPAPPASMPPVATRLPVTDSVLIPDNPTAAEVRRRRLKVLAWAASVLVVVGAGVFGIQVQMGVYDKKPVGTLRIRPEEFSTPGTVADSVAAARAAAAAAQPTAAAGSVQPPAPVALGAPAADVPPASNAAPQPRPAPRPQPPTPRQPASLQAQKRAGEAGGAPQSEEDRDALAARAAKATQALDRERNEQRGAAATAALDSTRRAAPPQAAAPAPTTPAVPTIDQRAQVANRIGLDEAARQLGGPLHAIDGMSRQLVGVVSPQLVPGSDTSRAVVRAVYVDRAGRLIFLDQQRVRPGQTDLPATPQARRNGELRWMSGQVLLVLQADLPTDSLRFIAHRVR